MVRIFVTGGTFDKRYNELDGTLTFQETHLPEMLRLGRCRLDVSITTLMMIDSLNMTLTDRLLILEQCRQIVLTGAMVPYAFGSSDGLFNLGSALSFVQALSPGIYVAMNGRCFSWDNVRKDRDTGVFEPL